MTLPILLAAGAAFAQPPSVALSLQDAERQAAAHSPLLAAAESDLAAAEAQAEAQLASVVPRLTLDGQGQYVTEVPKLAQGPVTIPFGSNESYNLGPTLSWTLWDTGGLLNSWRSQKALARSQDEQRRLVLRQVLLVTRVDYFQVQLDLEQELSLLESLRLAQAQFRDIDQRFRAGAASRIDWLSAREQVIERRKELRASQSDVAGALRALFDQTGRSQALDVSAPMDARAEQPLPPGVSTPTIVVALEPLEAAEAYMGPAAVEPLDLAYPQLGVWAEQAEAYRRTARSIEAGVWPRLQLQFRSYELYPNIPNIDSAWQNAVTVAASVPVFEFGQTRSRARAARAQADSAEKRRADAYDSLERDWHKARDALSSLRDQEVLDKESVDETAEIARLRFSSYKDGSSTILDVETANDNAVLARIGAARTRAQALIQLATLDCLSSKAAP